MKIKLFVAILVFSSAAQAQINFDSFWQKFKTAVVNADKTTVASLTKFPLEMPYGHKSIRSKADFINRYDKIMNLEANVKRCFQARKPTKDENGNYSIDCAFKKEPESSDNRPIVYTFTKTKTGWKFSGLDNINE